MYKTVSNTFERNYVVLKSKSSSILLKKKKNFNKSEMESKMEYRTHRFRETKNRKLKVKL